VLELKGLTRRYGDLVALDDLSFTVAEGQMFGFVGPNGAGKTTAMRIILGVLEPNAGEVRWRGQPMNDEIRKHIGYLPEDHGQTFSTQFAQLEGTAAATPCQFAQQTQLPPTYPPCRCSKTERHAREEQPAVQVRRRQVALYAQTMFAFRAPDPPPGTSRFPAGQARPCCSPPVGYGLRIRPGTWSGPVRPPLRARRAGRAADAASMGGLDPGRHVEFRPGNPVAPAGKCEF
jgi:ABC-type oligopeptide transport system ATPase subunit